MAEVNEPIVELRGFYGVYEVPISKAIDHMRFLASPAGREWREEAAGETGRWEENIAELRRHNRGEKYYSK